jgi:hypothetical protein
VPRGASARRAFTGSQVTGDSQVTFSVTAALPRILYNGTRHPISAFEELDERQDRR